VQLKRKLKLVGQIVAHTVAAVLGTSLLTYPVARLVRPNTTGGIIIREWVCSILFAAFLGALLAGYGKWEAANWAWIIPGAIFLVRALIYAVTWRTAFFSTFSGYECAIGLQRHDCQDFLEFSVPLIRGVSYSAGVWLATRISSSRNATAEEDVAPVQRQ
jgi:hypothetical protein